MVLLFIITLARLGLMSYGIFQHKQLKHAGVLASTTNKRRDYEEFERLNWKYFLTVEIPQYLLTSMMAALAMVLIVSSQYWLLVLDVALTVVVMFFRRALHSVLNLTTAEIEQTEND